MRDIQEVVEEALQQENLADSLRAELEHVEGTEYRPNVKEILFGRYIRPHVKVVHGSYVVAQETMQQHICLRNGLPRMLWHPIRMHQHQYDHEGELRACTEGIADRHGPIAMYTIARAEPQMVMPDTQYHA